MSSLKQMSAANLLYAGDFDVLCPIKWGQKDGKYIWFYGLAPAPMSGGKYDLTKGGFLHPYVGEGTLVTLCPSWRIPAGISNPAESSGTGGYGYNRLSFSSTISDTDKSVSNGRTKLGKIKRPTEILTFADCAMGGTPTGTAILVGKGFGMMDKNGTMHFRHGGMANAAWVDGHVSNLRFLGGNSVVKTGHFTEENRNFDPEAE